MRNHPERSPLRWILGATLIGALCLTSAAWDRRDPYSFATDTNAGRAWSFDGERLLLAGGESKAAALWDLGTGAVIQTFRGHTEPVQEVALRPDGKVAATVAAAIPLKFKPSTDNSIRLWDIASGKEIHRFDISGNHRGLAFSPDGKRLLSWDRRNTQVWDIATGRQFFAIVSTTEQRYLDAAFSPDSRSILVNETGLIRLFEYASGKERCNLGPETGKFVWSVEFSPDGRQIVAAVRGAIQIWDANTCHLVYAIPADTSSYSHASFSADGRRLVANLKGPPSAQLWDVRTAQPIGRFMPVGAQFVVDVSLAAGGKRLLTSSSFYHGTDLYFSSLWDVESGRELHRFDEGFHRLFTVGFSRDGRTVVVTDGLQPISLWNARTGELVRSYP